MSKRKSRLNIVTASLAAEVRISFGHATSTPSSNREWPHSGWPGPLFRAPSQNSAKDAALRSFAGTFGCMAGRTISKNFDVQPALKIQPEYKSTLSLIRTSCFLEREGREVQAKYAGDDFTVFWRILPLSGMKPNWLKKPCCRETVILAP